MKLLPTTLAAVVALSLSTTAFAQTGQGAPAQNMPAKTSTSRNQSVMPNSSHASSSRSSRSAAAKTTHRRGRVSARNAQTDESENRITAQLNQQQAAQGGSQSQTATQPSDCSSGQGACAPSRSGSAPIGRMP